MKPEYFMQLALEQAHNAYRDNEVPVGAIVVNSKDNTIVAKGYNQVLQSNNCCSHAEMLAIQEACQKVGNYRLTGLDLYVTLEPCAMCAGAIMHARINKVLFGASDEKFGSIVNNAKLFSVKYNYNHRPKWEGGILQEECANLLKTFFKAKRS